MKKHILSTLVVAAPLFIISCTLTPAMVVENSIAESGTITSTTAKAGAKDNYSGNQEKYQNLKDFSFDKSTYTEAISDPASNTGIYLASAQNTDTEQQEYSYYNDIEPVDDSSIEGLIKNGNNSQAKEKIKNENLFDYKNTNQNTLLHIAAKYNNPEIITWLIENNSDTEILNDFGDSPLHTALSSNSLRACQALVDGGADIFTPNSNGKTAFARSIEKGKDYYPIFITKESGNVKDVRGQTIVHYFARTGDMKGISNCIKQGLPLDIPDNSGKTPLVLAYSDKENPDAAAIAAMLLIAGAKPQHGEFEYFETTVKTRNAGHIFEDKQTPVHCAVIAEHDGILTYLLACGAKPNGKDGAGATPLHTAVRYGRINAASILLSHGADVDACDSMLKTPLLISAPPEKQNEIYTLLLDYNADITVQDTFGDNVLHIATLGNMSTALVAKLINSGALVNTQNKQGLTPLAQAVEQGNTDHIRIYVNAGADIFIQDNNGETPVSKSFAQDKTLKALITEENCNMSDFYANTPLHIAAEKDAPTSCITYLLNCGIKPNTPNCYGETPLFSALKADSGRIIQILTKAGAKKDYKDNQGNTALHTAVKFIAEKSAARLISYGYSIDAKNKAGKTPLAEAVTENRLNMVKLFISKGADVNEADITGKTILMDAIECKNPVAINILLSKGALPEKTDIYGRNAFHEAASGKNEAIISQIAKTGVNPLSTDEAGITPFSLVMGCPLQLIKILLGKDTTVTDSYGNTPLQIALANNASDELTDYLIGAGYPINHQNNEGKTALQTAVQNGLNKTAEKLLKKNALIYLPDKNHYNSVLTAMQYNPSILIDMTKYSRNQTDENGNSLLHYVATSADISVIKALIDNGANIHAKNKSNDTPKDIAERFGRSPDIIGLFQ